MLNLPTGFINVFSVLKQQKLTENINDTDIKNGKENAKCDES